MNSDQNKLEETTLGLYGYNLPIGVEVGTPPTLMKDFAFRPFRLIEERMIEEELKKKRQSGPAHAVLTTLKVMLTSFAGVDFTSASEKEKLSLLSSAYMTDILFAYLVLRVEALGEELEAPCVCPSCSTEWRWSADLNDLEVKVSDHVPSREVQLRSPIKLGEKEVSEIRLYPPNWSTLLGIKSGGSDTALKRGVLLSSIRELLIDGDWTRRPLPPKALDQLTKRDSETLMKLIDSEFPSIDLSIETECPSCGQRGVETVQWNHAFFFGSSSLPSTKRS